MKRSVIIDVGGYNGMLAGIIAETIKKSIPENQEAKCEDDSLVSLIRYCTDGLRGVLQDTGVYHSVLTEKYADTLSKVVLDSCDGFIHSDSVKDTLKDSELNCEKTGYDAEDETLKEKHYRLCELSLQYDALVRSLDATIGEMEKIDSECEYIRKNAKHPVWGIINYDSHDMPKVIVAMEKVYDGFSRFSSDGFAVDGLYSLVAEYADKVGKLSDTKDIAAWLIKSKGISGSMDAIGILKEFGDKYGEYADDFVSRLIVGIIYRNKDIKAIMGYFK